MCVIVFFLIFFISGYDNPTFLLTSDKMENIKFVFGWWSLYIYNCSCTDDLSNMILTSQNCFHLCDLRPRCSVIGDPRLRQISITYNRNLSALR